MKRPLIISVCLAVIVMIAALIWLNPQKTNAISGIEDSGNTQDIDTAAHSLAETNSTITDTTQSVASQPTVVSPDSLGATAVTNPIQPDVLAIGQPVAFETVRDKLWLPISEQEAADRTFVLYETQALYDKKIGDKVAFQANQFGINQTGTITQIEQVDEDIQRWLGSFDGLPNDIYRFRITQSKQDDYALAVLYTDTGIYELESKNGVGWIRPSQLLDNDGLEELGHEH